MKECYNCKGKLEEGVELIILNRKTIPQKILKCSKCGRSYTHIDEYEKVRKQIHPTLMDRLKRLFSGDADFIDLYKGKVL